MNRIANRLGLLALAVLLLTSLVACSSGQTVGEEIDDAAIGAAVKSKFTADPEINPFNIDVDVTDGVVRLSGMVEDEATRSEAVKIARNTDHVRRVVNEIEIGELSMGDRIDDAAITTKVKTALGADPDVDASDIDVDTTDGVVHLSGMASTQAEKDEATKVAKGVKGVKDVKNHLKVGGGM